jgi:hypothetical protein
MKINKEYKITVHEQKTIGALSDRNKPENTFTKTEKEVINSLYHKYLSQIDNKDWSKELYKMEMEENWPSGNRMGKYSAMVICLNFLTGRKNNMNAQDMWHVLNCRPSCQRVIKYAYCPY